MTASRWAALKLPNCRPERGTSLTEKFDQMAWPYCLPTKVKRPFMPPLNIAALAAR
jgi:hypothetical protein